METPHENRLCRGVIRRKRKALSRIRGVAVGIGVARKSGLCAGWVCAGVTRHGSQTRRATPSLCGGAMTYMRLTVLEAATGAT